MPGAPAFLQMLARAGPVLYGGRATVSAAGNAWSYGQGQWSRIGHRNWQVYALDGVGHTLYLAVKPDTDAESPAHLKAAPMQIWRFHAGRWSESKALSGLYAHGYRFLLQSGTLYLAKPHAALKRVLP